MAIYDNLNITIFLGVTVHMVSICVLILRVWKTHFGRWVCFKSVRYFAWRLSGPPLDTTLCLCFPGGTTSLFGDSIVKHKGILPCSLWKMISAQPLSGGSRMRLIQAQALQRWQDPREGKTSQKAKHLTDLTASDVWFWRHQLHRDSSPHPAFGKISWRSWSPFEMWYWYVLVRVLVLVLLFHEDFSNSVSSKSRLRLGGSSRPNRNPRYIAKREWSATKLRSFVDLTKNQFVWKKMNDSMMLNLHLAHFQTHPAISRHNRVALVLDGCSKLRCKNPLVGTPASYRGV